MGANSWSTDGLLLTSGNEQNEDTSSSVSGSRGCITSVGRGSQLPYRLAGAVAGAQRGVRTSPCPLGWGRGLRSVLTEDDTGPRRSRAADVPGGGGGALQPGAPAASWGSAHSGAVTLWLHVVKVSLKSFRRPPSCRSSGTGAWPLPRAALAWTPGASSTAGFVAKSQVPQPRPARSWRLMDLHGRRWASVLVRAS